MTNHLFILSAIYLMAALPSRAQQSDTALKSKYEHETLMLDANKNKYRKDRVWKKIGLFKPKIEREFVGSSPESKHEIEVFRKQRKRGTVLLITGGVVFASAAVFAPFIALPVFLAGFGGGLSTYFAGAFNLQKSRRHLHEAVWLHNRDVVAMQ